MKRFHDICISRRSEWDARSKELSTLKEENRELRDKLAAYETGCTMPGNYCMVCKHSRVTGNNLCGVECTCVFEIPCSKFEDEE